MNKRTYEYIFAIADNQEPFGHKDYLRFCKYVFDKYSAPYKKSQKRVIHVGDEVDQHTLGKWPHDPNGRSGGDELLLAIEKLKPWYKVFPDVSVCISNHSFRAWKKAFQYGIPQQFLKDISEVYEAPPGWKWADRWVIDDIVFEHGELVSGPMACLRAANANRMKTVIGHQHTNAGVIYSGSIASDLWGMNVGCGIDVDEYAFRYGKMLRNKPNLGCGHIIEGVPYFVPMILDKNKNWIERA